MLKPICIPCERFMRPTHNGRYFLEGCPTVTNAPSGKVAPELWEPYKLWSGDEWTCPDCGAMTIVGVGMAPISEHYLPEFNATCERYIALNRGKPLILIKDC